MSYRHYRFASIAARGVLIPLAVIFLAFPNAGRAGEDAAGAAAASDSAPATPAASSPSSDAAETSTGPLRSHAHANGVSQPAHRTVAQGIDAAVHRMARSLDLDPAQQVKLRQILIDQHRSMLALRNGGAGKSSDVAGTTLAIYDQTRTRIRAMLTEEQRQKYVAEVPRGELAPANADLQHYIDLQDAGRRQGLSEDEAK